MMFALAPHHRSVVAAGGPIITDGLVDLWDYSEKSGGTIGGLNGNDAILQGGSNTGWRTESDPRYQDSYEFAGGGEQAITPVINTNITGQDDFSIVTWIRPLNGVIAYTGAMAVGGARPSLHLDEGSGNWGFLWTTSYPSGDALPNDVWSFLAAVRDSTVMRYYRDAVQTPSTPSLTRSFVDYAMTLGGRGHPSQTTNCRLAMSRFYERALTPAEITLMFNGQG